MIESAGRRDHSRLQSLADSCRFHASSLACILLRAHMRTPRHCGVATALAATAATPTRVQTSREEGYYFKRFGLRRSSHSCRAHLSCFKFICLRVKTIYHSNFALRVAPIFVCAIHLEVVVEASAAMSLIARASSTAAGSPPIPSTSKRRPPTSPTELHARATSASPTSPDRARDGTTSGSSTNGRRRPLSMTPTAIRKRQSRMRQSEERTVSLRDADAEAHRIARAKQKADDPVAAAELRDANAEAHRIARAKQKADDPVAAAELRDANAEAHRIARAKQEADDPIAAAERRERDALAHRLATLIRRADMGDACAMLELSDHFDDTGDVAQAVAWLRCAAAAENTAAQLELGYRYRDGDGVPLNTVEAVVWVRRASGFSSDWTRLRITDRVSAKWAQYVLGRCYRVGLGVEACSKTAVKWYSRAIEQNDQHLRELHLGRCTMCSLSTDPICRVGHERDVCAEHEGVACAAYELALMVASGDGHKSCPARAWSLYCEASVRTPGSLDTSCCAYFARGVCDELGYGYASKLTHSSDEMRAQFSGAGFGRNPHWMRSHDCHHPDGCPYMTHIPRGKQDFHVKGDCGFAVWKDGEYVAVHWYRMAAATGTHRAAPFFLGCLIHRGYTRGDTIVPADPAEAVTCYRRSAEAGYAAAMSKLAACLIDGVGVAHDPVEAVSWLRRAVKKGDVSAKTELGICLDTGLGVQKNTQEAYKLLMDAADKGHPAAQMHIALFYLDSPVEALAMYRCATAAGPSAVFAHEDFYKIVRRITGSHEWALAWCHAADAGLRHDRRMQSYVASDEARKLLELSSRPGFGGGCVERIAGFLDRVEWEKLAALDDFLPRAAPLESRRQITAKAVGSSTQLLAAAGNTQVPSAIGSGSASSHDGIRLTAERSKEQALALYRRAADTGDVRIQFNLVLRAADAGDATAQYNVALFYADHSDSGVERDTDQAATWFERAAASGHVAAQFRLACCYDNGLGVPLRHGSALKWWERAADAGCAVSQFCLSRCYASHSWCHSADPERAVELCRLAAAAGYPGAQSLLDHYETAFGVPVNNYYVARFQAYLRGATSGLRFTGATAVSASLVADYYRLGRGVGKNDSEAIKWYTRAASSHDWQDWHTSHFARKALAKYYGHDFSSPDPSLSEITGTTTGTVDAALAVLPVSADQRELSTDNRHSEIPTRPAQQASRRQILADTQYDIALMSADAAQAVLWLQRAVDGGHAGAQFELGRCYEAGEGVPIDIAEAVRRYRLAADAGWADAQDMLGWCYKDGTGVEADAAEAVRWFRMAADSGDANALVDLGQCYEEGTGVAADLSQAIELYRRAAAAGDNNAKACCSRLGVQLL